MPFEAATLLGLALTIGALIYAIALVLTLQQTLDQHLRRFGGDKQAGEQLDPAIRILRDVPAEPKAKRTYVRKPKAAPVVATAPDVLGVEIDPRQLEIKP